MTLLLATPPDNPLFYMDALRAVSLASAVSTGLHELAVKVRYPTPCYWHGTRIFPNRQVRNDN